MWSVAAFPSQAHAPSEMQASAMKPNNNTGPDKVCFETNFSEYKNNFCFRSSCSPWNS